MSAAAPPRHHHHHQNNHSWSSASTAPHEIDLRPSDVDAQCPRLRKRADNRTAVESEDLLEFITTTQNGEDYNGHLESFSHGLQVKLREMMDLCQQLDNLRQSAQELLATSHEDDERAVSDLAARVAKLDDSADMVAVIERLRQRLETEREKVAGFQQRLDKVQSTIDAQKEREEAARRRVSWRLRMLWGALSAAVIAWLLATSGTENGVSRGTLDHGHEPIKLTPPRLDEAHNLDDIQELEELLKDSSL